MTANQILLQRLNQQRITRDPLDSPEAVVAWLGAVQAQEHSGGKWALGLRMQAATDAQVEQAFNAGRFLRTHAMRPTWHFVTPEDIVWLQTLTAPRVHAINAYMYRKLELDQAVLERSCEIIARELQGLRSRTRAELGQALTVAGIDVSDLLRLGYIMHYAELEALVCSGPRRGKQQTYALIAERAPQARILSRDEALAELTRRYFTGHGPAAARDFSWWSGLSLAEVKSGLEMIAPELERIERDGELYYFASAYPPSAEPRLAAYLLSTYDEFLLGYSAFDRKRREVEIGPNGLKYDSTFVIDGQIRGSWRRTLPKGKVLVELVPFAPLTGEHAAWLEDAARRYADFLELPVEIVDRPPG
jgi:hypothetical protein